MTTSEPLISVVIPTYNYGHFLPRAMDSVLSQWADDIELIVVDDGSTDCTSEVLAEYSNTHSALRVIRQENGGAAAARNQGIQLAKGCWVLLLDADDELLPDALAALREVVATSSDAGMVLGSYISVFEDGREKLRQATPISGTPDQLIFQYLLQKKIAISHCCSLFRRDLLLKCPYPQTLRAGEDIPVFAFMLVSAPVVVINTPLARIHKHSDSLRHQPVDGDRQARVLTDEVFSKLPSSCQRWKSRYIAQRYLSLFRAALMSNDLRSARYFYRRALYKQPLQAMRWTYSRKALRLLFK